MSNDEIGKLLNELEDYYPEGGYVSRAAIFQKALRDGKITEDIYEQAREYYGRLWQYTGD